MIHLLFLVAGCHLARAGIMTDDPIEFLSKKWLIKGVLPIRLVLLDDPIMISCETNSPYAKVKLMKRQSSFEAWQDVPINSDSRIKRIGQTFLIKDVYLKDSGYYKCVAKKWNGDNKELVKGQLIVKAVKSQRTPEIFPDLPVIKVEKNKDRNITCKTIGQPGASNSFLTWYHKSDDGSFMKVDESQIIRSGKFIGGNNIDIETLMLKKFSAGDVGDYICERRVYNSKPTRKVIRVEMKPSFDFVTKKWLSGENISIKMGLLEDYLYISCQTNNPHAAVQLFRREGRFMPWKNALLISEEHIHQIGQTFVIEKMSMRDSAYYKCVASNKEEDKIELNKGLLLIGVVNKEKNPEIIPNVASTRIMENADRNITCRTTGFFGPHTSLLQWYRRNKYGNFVYVDDSKIRRAEITDDDGNHIDMETIMFKNFNEEDVGEYLCVRKVFDGNPTKTLINVQITYK